MYVSKWTCKNISGETQEYKFTIQINLQKNIPKMVKPNLKTI